MSKRTDRIKYLQKKIQTRNEELKVAIGRTARDSDIGPLREAYTEGPAGINVLQKELDGLLVEEEKLKQEQTKALAENAVQQKAAFRQKALGDWMVHGGSQQDFDKVFEKMWTDHLAKKISDEAASREAEEETSKAQMLRRAQSNFDGF